MIFEWDPDKETENIRKHKIDFTTASKVFDDSHRIERFDEEHSQCEDRYITIGLVGNVVYLLTVSYTERGEAIRLISARRATREERRDYYDRSKRN
jgi:hypothetical protein